MFQPCWRYGANCEKLKPRSLLADELGDAGCPDDDGLRAGVLLARDAPAPPWVPRLVVELVVPEEDTADREEGLAVGGDVVAAPLDDELVRLVDPPPARGAVRDGVPLVPLDVRGLDDDERAGGVASLSNSKNPMLSHQQRAANRCR
jgi:hypothetical protein